MQVKEIVPTIVLGLLIIFSSCATKQNNSDFDKSLNQLLEQKNYFKLRELLQSKEDLLSEDRKLFYQAFVAKAFGEREQSNQHINAIFDRHKTKCNDTLLVKLLDLQAPNYLYNYQYKKASAIYEKILTQYPGIIDSADIDNYQNVANLFGTFANTKPQVMHRHSTVKIKSYRNEFNHLMIPAKSNGVAEDFIFDTGANLSTIAESQARKMGLTIFKQNVSIGSSTQTNVESTLAVADSLFVGDILFENVAFIVMPDEQLSFPQINYQIKGIIGFPIIRQLEEVRLHTDGSITVPNEPKKSTLQNMVLEGLNPVVKVISDRDTLLFTFDTGAANSELSLKYFNDHKNVVKSKGQFQTSQRGGAGGKTDVNEYMLDNFPMKIGTKSTSLAKIPVMLEEYEFNKYFDGNLGQDVFTKFNTLIINFKYMYVDFE